MKLPTHSVKLYLISGIIILVLAAFLFPMPTMPVATDSLLADDPKYIGTSSVDLPKEEQRYVRAIGCRAGISLIGLGLACLAGHSYFRTRIGMWRERGAALFSLLSLVLGLGGVLVGPIILLWFLLRPFFG